MAQGQIYKIHSDFYYVISGGETFECKIREVLKKQKEKILVGDFVEFSNGHITKLLPRKNFIKRPSVANIDQIIIVSALKEPDLDLVQLNRYAALAKYYGIPSVLCFNKEDLKWDKHLKEKIKKIYEPLGYKSEKLQRGTHTTRHCEIIKINEISKIVDTPGFSNVRFDFILPADVDLLFDDIAKFRDDCKYSDCLHINEDGCNVLANLDKIDDTRYESYLAFIAEAREYKEKLKYEGKKEEYTKKTIHNKTFAKISEKKRRSARNTLKQKIYKEIADSETSSE